MFYLNCILVTFFIVSPVFAMNLSKEVQIQRQPSLYFQFLCFVNDENDNQVERGMFKPYLARQRMLIHHVIRDITHRKNIIIEIQTCEAQKKALDTLIAQSNEPINKKCCCSLF